MNYTARGCERRKAIVSISKTTTTTTRRACIPRGQLAHTSLRALTPRYYSNRWRHCELPVTSSVAIVTRHFLTALVMRNWTDIYNFKHIFENILVKRIWLILQCRQKWTWLKLQFENGSVSQCGHFCINRDKKAIIVILREAHKARNSQTYCQQCESCYTLHAFCSFQNEIFDS